MSEDGWIEWHGGECPIDTDPTVQVKYRDGVVGGHHKAHFYDWSLASDLRLRQFDIIAYKVVNP